MIELIKGGMGNCCIISQGGDAVLEKIGAFTGFDPARWRVKMRIVEPVDRLADCAERDPIAEPNARLPKQILKTGHTQLYVEAVNRGLRAQRS